MKIIDACPFFNEIELLKIRLELLYDVVDAFCISESKYTFTGVSKPYNFELHRNEFSRWSGKIIYIKYEPDITSFDFSQNVDSFNPNSAMWHLERGQRNAIYDVCRQFADEDFFVVSDLDELVNPAVLQAIRNGGLSVEKARLEMQMHYFYMNCCGVGPENTTWNQGFVATVGAIKTSHGLSHLRVHEPMPVIKDAGWHFSYLGGVEKISTKISSFAHTELNTPEINNLEHLKRCMELGLDQFSRPGYMYAFWPVARYPEKLARLMLNNPHLLRTNLV